MPVTLYTGSPGSGKTYYVVKNAVLTTIRSRRMVITNIRIDTNLLTEDEKKFYIYINPLDKTYISEYRRKIFFDLHRDFIGPLKFFDPKNNPIFSLPNDYKYFHINENGQAPLFVIDECQKILSKSAKPSKMLIEFYQEHRHFSEMDIYLVTQGQKYLNETLKELIEETFYLQKARFKGKNVYHVRKYAGLRDRSTAPQLNRSEKYDQSVFKYYKSQTQSDQEVKREETNKSSKFITYVKYFSISMIFLFLFVSWKTFTAFGESVVDEKQPPASNSQPVTISEPAKEEKLIVTYYDGEDPENSQPVVEVVEKTEAQKIGEKQSTDYYEYKNENFRPSLPEREPVSEPKAVEHAPFFNYHISIAAYIESKDRFLATFKIYHSENAVKFTQTHEQFMKAGYTVTFLNNCLALIDHPREQNPFYVHCEVVEDQKKMKERKI